jgi:two-component system, chemotaxis family, response regulator Rcp1
MQRYSLNERSEIKILLVDDSAGDVRLMREALKEGKVKNDLFVVPDGVEALAFLRKEKPYQDVVRPDLILLDLNMPRMDGRETLKEIKADPDVKRIPVVILTTSDDEGDILKAYDHHANCFITKPVELDKLVEIVQKVENFWVTFVKLPGKKR